MAFVTFDVDAKVLRIGKKWSDIKDYTDVVMIYDIDRIRHGRPCKGGEHWLNGFDERGDIKCMVSNVREVENKGTKNDTRKRI